MKLCNYQLSEALYALGYDDPNGHHWMIEDGGKIPMPRLDDAAYYLAERCHICITPMPTATPGLYCVTVMDIDRLKSVNEEESENYKSLEDALQAGLIIALNYIKDDPTRAHR